MITLQNLFHLGITWKPCRRCYML